VVRQLDPNPLGEASTGGSLSPERMERGLQSYVASSDYNE
jgi:hypothetical protein